MTGLNKHIIRVAREDIAISALLLLFCCGHVSLIAHVFQRYTEDEGLPINIVNDMTQDSLGFIWIATEAGLTRFDGVHFKQFGHEPGDSTTISTNSPMRLLRRTNGDLWVASADGILNLYDWRLDVFHRYPLTATDPIPDKRVYGMYESEEILWIGTESGLIKFNTSDGSSQMLHPGQLLEEPTLGYNVVFRILPDPTHHDRLWLLTINGLLSFDTKTRVATEHRQDQGANGGRNSVLDGWFSPEEGILFLGGSKAGLRSYAPDQGHWEYYNDSVYPNTSAFGSIARLAADRDLLWIASPSLGFGSFDMTRR
jgi:ligand-binding sensor domain-containing protein